MSRKKIKPTEEGMEDDDDDDPGITKLMGDCDDLIKGLESDTRSFFYKHQYFSAQSQTDT